MQNKKDIFFDFCIAEAHPIFDDSQSRESRMQCKTKKTFFLIFALLRRILSSLSDSLPAAAVLKKKHFYFAVRQAFTKFARLIVNQ